MEAEDPLKDLRDIHLPDAVTFWPPAPGWWLLLVLLLIGLAYLYRHAITAMIRRRKLAAVLRELDAAYVTYEQQSRLEGNRNQAGLDYLATVNILLKRVAQVVYPDSGSGRMTGRQWLAFLDRCDTTTAFSEGAGRILGDGVYRPSFDGDAEALKQLVSGWIEHRYQTGTPGQTA